MASCVNLSPHRQLDQDLRTCAQPATGKIHDMLPLLLAAAIAANDSTVYPVLNHGRLAGSMIVVKRHDTVTVRYVFTDRNRGTRIETRSVMNGDVVRWFEERPVLANEQAGDPLARFEIVGDSLRQIRPARTTMESIPLGKYVDVRSTPVDHARIAAYLLRQQSRSAKLFSGGTGRAEVVKETMVSTSRGNERARLVTITTGNLDTPQAIWLDEKGELLATEISWFMTVRAGPERGP